MDVERRKMAVFVFVVVVEMQYLLGLCLGNNLVLNVQHKFVGQERSMGAYKSHDSHRHGRMLVAADFPLGGNSRPTDAALYYTKIGIGTPPTEFHVQVDTGSDLLWVNCAGCDKCPKKSKLGIELHLYNPKGSATAKPVTCDQEFCSDAFNNNPTADCKAGMICEYSVTYGDGSTTAGYFVSDHFQFNRVSGNFQTSLMNGSVAFGCGAKQSGELGSSSEALDGIIGFGQANSSVISQLASSGKVKKVFSHCLEGANDGGGGIFAIGELVQPKVKSTPLVPDSPHYNVILEDVKVGDDVLDLPTGLFDFGSNRGTIIDSGTTLAYLTDDLYNQVIKKIMSTQSDLKTHVVEKEFTCFSYSDDVDKGFPVISFHFENSLSLSVYPHQYLFRIERGEWCIGWQNSALTAKDGKEINILGDLALSNKIVVYDLENQTVGWTDYNCSSSVKVKDDGSGNVYLVGAHDISKSPVSILKFSRKILTLGMTITLILVSSLTFN
ncbi:hypothetical protein LguiB_001885 [Lonicera macranthoides]